MSMQGTLIAVLFLSATLLISGCISLGGASEATSTTATPPQDILPSTTSLMKPVMASTTTQAGLPGNRLSVRIAGCDDDRENNTMVAGYVTNPDNFSSNPYIVIVQLRNDTNAVVDGGMMLVKGESLQPGETRKFSAIFAHPPYWRRCTATMTDG